MKYCYMCDTCGQEHEVEARMGKAPKSWPCHCGGQAERDFSAEGGKVNAAYQQGRLQYPYVSNRLPRHLAGCPTDKQGKPVILSQAHEREVASRHGYTRD